MYLETKDLSTPQNQLTEEDLVSDLPAVIPAPAGSFCYGFYNTDDGVISDLTALHAFTVDDNEVQRPVFYGSAYQSQDRVFWITGRVDGEYIKDVTINTDALESLWLNTKNTELLDIYSETKYSIITGIIRDDMLLMVGRLEKILLNHTHVTL